MSAVNLLVYGSHLHTSFIGRLDPRVKILISLGLSTYIILNRTPASVALAFFCIICLQIFLDSVYNLVQYLYYLKWGILTVGFFAFLGYYYQTSDLVLAGWLSAFLVLRVIGISLAFSVFNRTTSPEMLLDALIKMRVPSALAWKITTAYRQAIFYVEELNQLQTTIRTSQSGFFVKNVEEVRNFIRVYTMALVRAIIRSKEFSNTLQIRGFHSAHAEITLHTHQRNTTDLIISFLAVLIFIILWFV